jgi:hypothetical protein
MIEVRQVALVADRAPRAGEGAQVRRDEPGRDGLFERLAKERREELVLLAGRLDVPFRVARPVAIRLRVRLHRVEEAALVHPGHREHDRCRQHLLAGRLAERRTGTGGDVRIAGRIDDPLREDRLTPRLALRDDAADRTALDDRIDAQPMEERLDAGLLDEGVGDDLEHLGLEGVADRLRLGRRGAHRLGSCLELDADALAVDRGLVAIPGEALDADLGDVAPEAAVPVEERRPGARPGRR